jgi:hypothetical protein
LSQAGAHGRKRKFHRIGRHASPSSLGQAARRARLIVPAMALAGALATGPYLYHLATASPAAMAGDLASAGRSSSGHSPGGATGATGRTGAGSGSGHVATADGAAHDARPGSRNHSPASHGRLARPVSAASPRA